MARTKRAARSRTLAVLLLLPLLVLVPAVAGARAGGGGDFSPGGGGDGGGDGAGALLYLAFRLVVWAFSVHPLFGLAMLCTVVGVGAMMRRNGSRQVTRRRVRREQAGRFAAPDALRPALAELGRRDERFAADRFLARVRSLFSRVQAAWSDGDLRPVRPGLSDGVWNRFHALVALDRVQGRRNVVADVAVRDLKIVAAVVGEEFDELHVRIEATARDAYVPAAATRPGIEAALERAQPAPFVEIWSFLRRRGATSGSERGALEGACPSCGATVAGGDVVQCEHCGTLVNSGSHDWVLAEITQEVTWSGVSTATVPGLEWLRQRDPGASRQAIEDRASLLFWRWLESMVTGDVARLPKVVAPALLDRLREQHATPAALTRLAVGGVDLDRVDGDEASERAHVRVVWSAQADGAAEPHPRTHVLVLERRAGAARTAAGLTAESCGQCGAPLSATDSPRCDYCGADLAAGEGDFVLLDVMLVIDWLQRYGQRDASSAEPAMVRLLPDPAVPLQRERLLYAMIASAAADGVISAGERRLLLAAADRYDVARVRVKAWIEELGRNRIAEVSAAGVEGPLLVRGLAAVALVDGKIDRKERALLRRMGARAGLAPEAVEAIVATESRRLERLRAA